MFISYFVQQLQQRELKKQAAARAARLARLAAVEGEHEGDAAGAVSRREGPRRRPCTVRVNNLHTVAGADAIETDVWVNGEFVSFTLHKTYFTLQKDK